MLRAATLALGMLALSFVAAPSDAAISQLLPNLEAQRASQLRIEAGSDGRTYLRLSATSWNSGLGPLEVVAGATDSVTGKQQVYQRIYNSDGSFTQSFAGHFDWHPQHNHVHFDDYALYTLDSVSAPGSSLRTAAKTTFCIIDTTRVKRMANSPKRPVYTTCTSSVQGLSVGWGDTYPYSLPGQAVDITGLPDGDYTLRIDIDPKGRIIETDEDDNSSSVLLRLSGRTVTVLDGKPGRR
jgi:hypothetical protein